MYKFFFNQNKKKIIFSINFCIFAFFIRIILLVDLFSDIIKRCRQGDRRAQEAIYNLLAGKMFAVCLRYCTNYEDAKDLLHDGFVTIFTKIDKFNNIGSFEGWVRRIFVNQAIELYRNKAKVSMVECSDENERLFIEPDNNNEMGYGLSEDELLSMVEKLPQQYKIVFNLYAIEGLSHRDIAGQLGISESTSRSNLLRARSIMQKQVKNRIDPIPVIYNASK